MTALLLGMLSAVWQSVGGYILSALAGAAAIAFVRLKRGNSDGPGQSEKSQQAEKRGEETALLAKQLGEAAQTAATVDSAQRGVNAQSDDRLRDVAASRWVRK